MEEQLEDLIEKYTEGNYLFGQENKQNMRRDILVLFGVSGMLKCGKPKYFLKDKKTGSIAAITTELDEDGWADGFYIYSGNDEKIAFGCDFGKKVGWFINNDQYDISKSGVF